MTSYREVFKDFPYTKFFDSVERGNVDFDNETIKVGQIYIFVRKYIYSNDIGEDLIAVKTILPQQLENLFSPPYTKKNFPKGYGTMPSGSKKKTMHSLPMDDVFFMSCVSIDANTYKDRAWGGRQAINETGKVVDNLFKDPLQWSDSVLYFPNFKFCEASLVLDAFYSKGGRYKSFDSQLMFKTLGWDNYGGALENLLSWAYLFKVPINTPIREFMNWNSNPFT